MKALFFATFFFLPSSDGSPLVPPNDSVSILSLLSFSVQLSSLYLLLIPFGRFKHALCSSDTRAIHPPTYSYSKQMGTGCIQNVVHG